MGYTIGTLGVSLPEYYKTEIILDAIELLQDGFPLDEETKKALEKIGENHIEFTRRFEIKTKRGGSDRHRCLQ